MIRSLPLLLLLGCPKGPPPKAAAPDVPRDDATWLDLRWLHGPFTDVPGLCRYVLGHDGRPVDPLRSCGEEPPRYGSVEGTTSLPASGRWKGAMLLPVHQPFSEEARDEVGWGGEDVHLVVETARGRFVGPPLAQTWNPGAFGVQDVLVVEELAWRDFDGRGETELWLKIAHERTDADMGIYEVREDRDEALVLCELGDDDLPACSEPVPLEQVRARLPLSIDVTTPDAELPTEPYLRIGWTSSIEIGGEGWLGIATSALPPLGEEDPRVTVKDVFDPAAPPTRSLVPRVVKAPIAWDGDDPPHPD